MANVIVMGGAGKLGKHLVDESLRSGHATTVVVRDAGRLSAEVRSSTQVIEADIATTGIDQLASFVSNQDALLNAAGTVGEGPAFVSLFDRIVAGVEAVPPQQRPVCWFLAGAALLDVGGSGRRGVDLPVLRKTYWPHDANLRRASASTLDWRLLCPGPMVDEPAIGVHKMRVSSDRLPVEITRAARWLPSPILLAWVGARMAEMIVPYANAARLILDHIGREDPFSKRRVGLALPVGMKGRKKQWMARPKA